MLNTDIISDTTCIDNISLNTSSMCMCNRNVAETIYDNRQRTATALSDRTSNDYYDLFRNSSHYQCDNNLYLASDRNKFRARYNINIPLITTAKKSYLIEQRKGEKDTMISNQIKNKIYEFAKLKLLNKFHTSAIVSISNDHNMKIFLKWLSKYDKYWRHRVTKNESFYAFINMDIFIVIDKNTLCRIRTNDYIKKDMTEYDMLHNNYSINSYTIKVDLYGKQCFTIIKFLKTLSYFDKLSCYKIVYNAGNSDFRRSQTEIYYSRLLPRSKDTVFLDYTNMDRIFLHINKFLSNKEKYHARDLLFKTGILLYGPPGTGKSTVARMICSEYKMSMVLIDMSQFNNIDIDYITTSINADDHMYVVVLEDIDRVMDTKDSDRHEAVNKLLQFLDSSSSPTDVIFVATTNHLDRLDPAIVRDGRFDITFNIENIHKDAAFRMMYSFGLNINACMEIWKNNSVDGVINPARLQNLILNYQGEKEIDLQEE